MRTTEELLDEVENANDGDGPTPIVSYYGTALSQLMDAIEERDRAEGKITVAVERARADGASWAMIGQVLGMTRQGALKHFRELDRTSCLAAATTV